MNSTIAIIPARYLSTRFPGKPLADIAGKSMICRVYEQCIKSRMLSDVYVATDDERILHAIRSAGGKAILTGSMSVNGTERCFDAYQQIAAEHGAYDCLLNIQGDEPFIDPSQIDELCEIITTTDALIATLIKRISLPENLWDENIVKVAMTSDLKALYFSRSAIPCVRGADKSRWLEKSAFYKHIGIYAFKTAAIPVIKSLSPTPMEKAENLEQLRWLENGLPVQLGITQHETISVDTPQDLERAVQYARGLQDYE